MTSKRRLWNGALPAVAFVALLMMANNVNVGGGGLSSSRSISRMTAVLGTRGSTLGPGAVTGTLVLANGTYLPGNFLANEAEDPLGGAYDPATGDIYVANGLSSNVSVINGSTDQVVGDFPTYGAGCGTSSPTAVTYDPDLKELYVADSGCNRVLVMNPLSGAISATVTVKNGPDAIAYDATDGDVFVGNYLATDVSVIRTTNNTVITTIALGGEPAWVDVDTATGFVFVASYSADHVVVINPTTLAIAFRIPLPTFSAPSSLCYESGDNEVFVADYGTDNVTVINATTYRILSNITVGNPSASPAVSPNGIACTPTAVYVTDGLSDTVYDVDPATNAVLLNTTLGGGGPNQAVYDPASHQVFISNLNLIGMSVISSTTGALVSTIATADWPWGIALDTAHNDLWIANQTLPGIQGALWKVTMAPRDSGYVPMPATGSKNVFQAGLDVYNPANGDIYATAVQSVPPVNYSLIAINSATSTRAATVSLANPPGALAYDSANSEVYVGVGVPGSGTETLYGIGSSNTVVSTLALPADPYAMTYDPASGDLYLETYWNGSGTNLPVSNLTIVNPVTNTVVSSATIGAASHGMAYDPANQCIYFTDLTNGLGVYHTANSTIAYVALPSPNAPTFDAYDPANGDVYVSNQGNNSVIVVNATASAVAEEIAVGSLPEGITTNATGSAVYVTDSGGGALTVISPSASSVVVRSVSLGTPTDTIGVGGSAYFNATPSCGSGVSCPSGIVYTWSQNNTLGSLNTTSGPGVRYSAGSVPGSTTLTVRASLGGAHVQASVAITVSSTPPPALASVAISPTTESVAIGGSASFAAVVACTGGPCLPGSTYSWSVNNGLGTLNSTTGSVVKLTAGSSVGTLTVTVTASLNGHQVSGSATVTITASSSSGGGMPPLLLYGAIGGAIAVVAVVAAVLALRARGRRANPPPPAPPAAGPPAGTVSYPPPPPIPPPYPPPPSI